MGVYYLTKWVEVIPFINVNKEEIIIFIQNHVIYRFRILKTLTTVQGSIFTSQKMIEFASESKIKLLTSTPYYAQENG